LVENGVTGYKVPIESECGDTVTLWDGRRWGIPLGRRWGNINIDLLAKQMITLVKHPDIAKEVGERARTGVINNLNWYDISGKLLREIYNE